MKRVSATGAWRRARILGTVLAVAALCLVPATAKSSKAEKAVGGRTIMEQAADQLRLHTELAPRVPKGVTNEPVVVDIDQGDRDALAAPYDPSREPMRIGVVKEISRMIGKRAGGHFTGGVLDESANGSFVWAASFESHGAQAIRLRLQDFFLPSGAEMYLLGDNGQAHGPYTDRGRNGSGEFWTRAISGEKATLILTYGGPNAGADKPRISFVVSDVGSIHGRPPRPQERVGTWPCNDNVSCLVDAQCINSGPAVPAKDAVAKMEWIQGPYIYTCTGGLLADTDGSSQIPYFLSANHCLSNSNSSLETFFFYQTSSCEGSCPDSLVSGGNPPPASTVGVTVLASGSAGDYTLMTLNEAPPAGVTYLAWNNAAVSGTSGTHLYRVSNANFGPQVYSQHDVDATSPTCTSWPRGQRIYSVDIVGATMGGSSGSPVMNGNSEVVGQLSGCCGYNCGNECDSANNWTVDGALAYYWGNVSQYLDPPAGCTTNAECDDGQFCTGTETCVSGSCQSSGDPCTGNTTCNEATDTCDVPVCDNDGACEAGEDCNNCPNDCRAKTNGSPSSRYCCDGDLPNCGNANCSANGWVCGGGGGGCSVNADCDDGLWCNGAETCSGGTCQSGSNPCPGQGCDENTDSCYTCGGNKASCNTGADCCSGNCRGGSCKGN